MLTKIENYDRISSTNKVLMKPHYRRGFQKWLAKALEISEPRLSLIINEKRSISMEIAFLIHNRFPAKDVLFWYHMPILNVELCLWDICKEEYLKSIKENNENPDT